MLGSIVRAGIGAAAASVTSVWPAIVGAASRVTIGYLKAGYTCEGSTFAAREQGYFRDEGLELTLSALPGPPEIAEEMMKGRVDAMHDPAWTLVQPLLPKGMSVGDMVATAGLQRGSMSIVVAADAPIRSVADLRGRKVSAGARWRFMFSEPLRVAGLDSGKDVQWQPPLPPAQVGPALKGRQVDAAMVHQPYAAALESSGEGRILIAQNTPPHQGDYCCCVIVTSALIRSDREKAAAITRALMRGSAWIRAHAAETAQLEIDVKHVSASLRVNQRAMATLEFAPSVAVAQRNTFEIIQRFKRQGLLDPTTDERGTLDRIFIPVTGEL